MSFRVVKYELPTERHETVPEIIVTKGWPRSRAPKLDGPSSMTCVFANQVLKPALIGLHHICPIGTVGVGGPFRSTQHSTPVALALCTAPGFSRLKWRHNT